MSVVGSTNHKEQSGTAKNRKKTDKRLFWPREIATASHSTYCDNMTYSKQQNY